MALIPVGAVKSGREIPIVVVSRSSDFELRIYVSDIADD